MWRQGTPDKAWDDTLFSNGGHFLQSSHWAAFNEALGKTVFYGHGDDWQCLAILEASRTGTRLYCPYGPLADDEPSLVAAFEALTRLARKQKALFVRIEPLLTRHAVSLGDFKLKRALKDIQPPQTWVLNLEQSDEAILSGFTSTNRNLYHTAPTKGLKFRRSHDPKDMAILTHMIHDVVKNTGITAHSDTYYATMAKVLLPRKAATLYIAEHKGTPVGAAFVFDSPTTRYYAHAGNLTEARKLHAGTPLLATMIFDAKKQGQTLFDFVGVAPVGVENHPWEGFSKFKRSFGGEYKFYSGTWELPTHPLYKLYRGVYQAHRKLYSKKA
jgi:lipid II:glycine glycyltransferase (peptidoglycan interpeptide bridge formation enzyme)